ncbi:FAD-dependent oxidoreductase [Sphingobacterium sp. DK4209]|uniref:FAD-dependent oxidoreductase n=1 Tax=Sphingobacterium zhuxiongii TaxID=2662364 RepID=A0A5Q0QBM4_9SPHI|nr:MULTISPECIES: FAD-binding oxidoreductase [unclassified Sphingobacterium]MVZ66742.1 FAD-dependent oxidoreductase [Sphingobacterium sp. DK4209]QGA26271.1 FAD-dependent oxidoreductase [Sphingobacterium sp. dk4302]
MDLKSNEPFWLIKNGILNSYPSLHQDAECDVLIVGSGITGSLVAHQCIQDGLKTILIDKREVCNGSTSATTSMLQYEIDAPLYQLKEMLGEKTAIASYKACSDAIDRLAELCDSIKSKAGFRRKNSLYFASAKKDVPWLFQEFEARAEAGFEVEWLESEQILKDYGIHKNFGGILSKQGASVDAFTLAHELLALNHHKGLQIYDKTELVEVEYKKGFNLCTLNTQAKIKAKKIVYCVGYESASMIKEKFVNLLSTYAIISEVDKKLWRKYKDILMWNTSSPYLYMRTSDDFRFLIGGEDEDFQNPEKRDRLLKIKSKKIKAKFESLFPEIEFRLDFRWAGTFGETKDALPYIGEHQDFKNSYFVLGFGGNGITFSVTGMEMVSDWIKGKKHPLSNAFRFGR